jgi:hypothetical protein
MRGLPRAVVAPLLAALGLALACAPARAVDRNALEAAIVYNLLLFVEWPGEAASETHALTLCLDGASPLLAAARGLEGRPVRGLRLAVRALDDEPRHCQAIVVDSVAALKAASTVRNNSGKDAVLLVEGSAFDRCEAATIRLVEAGDRIAFDISQQRAHEIGVAVSSRLLRLARNVTDRGPP